MRITPKSPFGLMKRRSLVFRLLVLSVAAATIPALVISAVQRSISSHALRDSIQDRQTELARRIAEEVNGEVTHARSVISVIAHSSFFSAGSRVDQYEALRNVLREVPAFQEAMFVGDQGDELLKVSQGHLRPTLFRRSENLKQSFIGNPFFSGNRSPTILVGEPIRSYANPTRTGAVLAKLSFTSLGSLLKEASVGPLGSAFIVDSKGQLLAHADESRVFAHSNLSHLAVVAAWMEHPDRPTDLHEYLDDKGVPTIAIAYPIPLLQSAVIVEEPRSDVYAPLRRMQKLFVLCAVAFSGAFGAIAFAVAWRILTPMRKLRAAAEEVGQGHMDVHLDIHTGDEMEDLGIAFEAMATSLRELERLRRDLISMVVHDLKMPLSTILPSLDSLATGDLGPVTPGQSQFLQMARRSAQEMLMLIQNLLDVARMEEGKLQLYPEAFLPADWAESIVATFRPLAHANRKRLDLVIANGMPVVQGDIALLGRVLGNLISNALRYVRQDSGEVTVSLYPEGKQLAVQVRDNGEGIAEEDQERIFEKFVQGQGERTHVRSGTGLGLTFCKMVVEAHGGRITVFSQAHEGSLFTFYIPLSAPVDSDSDGARSSPSTKEASLV